MGSGGSKNKENKKGKTTAKPAGPVVPESKPTQVPPANAVRSRSPSFAVPEVPRTSPGQRRSPSIRAPQESRGSGRANDENMFDDNDDANRTSRPVTNALVEPLAPLANGRESNPSKSTTHRSVALSNRGPSGNSKRASSHASSNRKGSTISIPPEDIGACPHCSHCKKEKIYMEQREPKPDWFIKSPGPDQTRIDMDEYDEEAILGKTVLENGARPGRYDYQGHLTIVKTDRHEQSIDKYAREPFVAKTNPFIMTTHTPFPNYAHLESHEHRVNKPYSMTLFKG